MKTNNINIRTESPEDYPHVYNLNTKAFGRGQEAQLVDRLRTTDSFVQELSLVATSEDRVVGYILFTKINIINGEGKHRSLALAPMSVDPDFQKQGIGIKLVKHGLQRAKELGYTSVLVLGHEQFYPRFGFEPTIKWDIKAPLNIPESSFMGLELEEGALHGVSGRVEYPIEFMLV